MMSGLFGKLFFFSSRSRHTIFDCDWSLDVCSSDLAVRCEERRHATRTLAHPSLGRNGRRWAKGERRSAKATTPLAPRLSPLGTCHLAHLVGLDDVAFLDVAEGLEGDAALEPCGDTANVVLEPANRSDRSIVDHHPIAHETHPGTAWDLALRDVRAGDGAVPGSPKGHTHLGRPEVALHLGGGEPP